MNGLGDARTGLGALWQFVRLDDLDGIDVILDGGRGEHSDPAASDDDPGGVAA
ncbi:hypothetical protein ACWEQ8_35030 [Streptomyces noursei]